MHRIGRIIRATSVLTAMAVPPPAHAAAQRQFPPDEDLQLMLRYLVEDGETPGIMLGILEADGTRRILSYGSAGPDALPLGPKSVFELGSITKAFTGILLADMVDRGEVALEDPVQTYLPDGVRVPSRNGREITLLDLATHRSSLPRMPDNIDRDDDHPYPEHTVQDLYAFLSSHELRRDIGAEYEYSNVAVALLGDVLARAAGRTYEELLRERILDPLEMDMTSTVVAGELRRWQTRGHDEQGKVAPYRNWPHLPAMGAIRSNAEDMLAFLDANLGEPGSRLERVMRVAQEERAPVDEGIGVALNWRVYSIGDRRIITHSGSTAGYETRVAFDPGLRVGFVLLTNTGEFDDDIGLDFLRRGPPLDIPVATLPDSILARYPGAYEYSPGRNFVVRLEQEGWLTLQAPPNVRFRMYAESDTSFFLKRTPWRLAFTRGEGGAVTGVVLDIEGRARALARVGDTAPPPAVVAGNAALDLPLAAEAPDQYIGTYAVQVGEQTIDIRVFVENGVLMGQPQGQPPSRLLYQGDHAFVPAVNITMRLTFTLEHGRAETVAVRHDGAVYRGVRKPPQGSPR